MNADGLALVSAIFSMNRSPWEGCLIGFLMRRNHHE